jgi:hypothetical protein
MCVCRYTYICVYVFMYLCMYVRVYERMCLCVCMFPLCRQNIHIKTLLNSKQVHFFFFGK